ncbi:hypothetical protein GCM10027284_46600 [Cyclobacterium sediminis]
MIEDSFVRKPANTPTKTTREIKSKVHQNSPDVMGPINNESPGGGSKNTKSNVEIW